jgi:myo-inositol catabolism protein IolS
MRYKQLGECGLDVSVLSFGAWQIGDTKYWGADDEADHDAAVHAAVDAGITLFDTAEMYGDGQSEIALGRALGHRRDKVLIASKVLSTHCEPEAIQQSCEASLKRLGTDYLDLYQVHWPCREVPFDTTYEALERLKDAGKIRAIGVSNFGPCDLDAWMTGGRCSSNQIGYNLAFRAPEFAMLPACTRYHLGVLVYVPLLQGILTYRWKNADDIPAVRRRTRHFASSRTGTRHGEPGCETLLFEMLGRLNDLATEWGRPLACAALAWLLAQPAITSVIIGARNPAQLKRNVEAVDCVLTPQQIARIDAITKPLKDALGPNLDMWLGSAESRIR